MEWTIQQLADSAGVTSRTLRHYDDIGLLPPVRVGHNGYRFYDADSVARLQRILLLRELGLSLPVIAEVLDRERDEDKALGAHLRLLEAERARLDARIRALRHTLDARAAADGSLQMLLEGFNDPYRDEVIARWGERAYTESNAWWHGKTLAQQRDWKRDTDDLIAAWIAAWKDGQTPTSPHAQTLAARHVDWLRAVPGTPLFDGDRDRSIAMLTCIADTYVTDENFTATYGGPLPATFVRDTLLEYTRRSM
ncbi:MerR family transcriptional regulator [Nocardia sp. CDC153]|uniref:MerR family transcriptional regulator n=1 Tax=Nocardia sp. CDC153 TaxID=3112167 RepID=UPI002DBCC66E|nr:MerR family transcriptional regulator [Nocardia sp. CDC153]MEC3953358.1 MerR family transcriptional regulator [Nocardia sp. CDC153]